MREDCLEEVKNTLLKYENSGENEILEYIDNIIINKNGKWDSSIKGSKEALTKLLIFEYASSLEKLSNGKLKAIFVIDKLSSQMGTLRYGDFDSKQDNNIKYGGFPVTSEEYKNQCRMSDNFGAHTISYEEIDKKQQDAIVLFDNKQISENGNKLSGIDLNNLSDIRHTIFHEFTHVMEKSLVEIKEIKDVVFEKSNSKYINSSLSPELAIEEYQKYIDNISLNGQKILFSGVSTIEINLEKSPNKRIMHNQISEGFTEHVARLVMKEIGDEVEHTDRYSKQEKFAEKVFMSRGIENSLKDYCTSSNKIISELENIGIDGKDLLHFMSDSLDLIPKLEQRLMENLNDNNIDDIKSKVVDILRQNPDEKCKQDFVNNLLKDIKGRQTGFNEPEENAVRNTISQVLNYKDIENSTWKKVDEKISSLYDKINLDEKETSGSDNYFIGSLKELVIDQKTYNDGQINNNNQERTTNLENKSNKNINYDEI